MAGSPLFVTLNRTMLKLLVRQALWNVISTKVDEMRHTNHDDYFSPSEWWFDKNYSRRHYMSTSGVLHFGGGKLTVYLTYNVHEH